MGLLRKFEGIFFLADRIALITGGSRGIIGRAAALAFASAGADEVRSSLTDPGYRSFNRGPISS